MPEHPCTCDICLKARRDEIYIVRRTAREEERLIYIGKTPDELETEAQKSMEVERDNLIYIREQLEEGK